MPTSALSRWGSDNGDRRIVRVNEDGGGWYLKRRHFVPPPVLSGAGSFIGSYECFAAGAQANLIAFPTAPVIIGCVRLVTIVSSDATAPTVTVTDDDGGVFVTVAGQPANQVQFTCVSIASHAVGGNKVHVVWPNAINHAHDPHIFIQDFNALGS